MQTRKQLTEQEANFHYKLGLWSEWTDLQIVEFQLYQERLGVGFWRYQKATEAVLGRTVYTHEFADAEKLRVEYQNSKASWQMKLTHGGLFSGIGGFSLAAQWMGWTNVFDVEIDPFCRQVLHKNFPTTQLFEDVTTFSATPFRGTVDVLSGGFPCQPFSLAGLRKGEEDPRALWPQMLRIVRELAPRYVVAENVLGLLSIESGLVFEQVCASLEAEGYQVQTFILPACGVGAPQRRHRKLDCCPRP